MDSIRKEQAVTRLLTGTVYLNINKRLYKQGPPTRDHRALANLFYNEVLNDIKFSELVSRDQAKFILHRAQIWTPSHEKQLKDYQTYTEDLKIQLYKALYNAKEQKAIRRKIKGAEKSITTALTKKHSLDSMTFEHHAEMLLRDFLIALSITDPSNNYVYTYENFWESDGVILNSFVKTSEKNALAQEEYREIARTEPFRSHWALGKENIFGIPSCDLSYEQKTMILYARMYDSAYESMDRPSDQIIEDDWMFDGWMAKSRREVEKQRKQKEVEDLLGSKGVNKHNVGNAGEMFVVAKSKEEAAKIKELNDLNSRMKLEQKIAAVEKSGSLEEGQLPDVKLELRKQAMRQMADKSKGK